MDAPRPPLTNVPPTTTVQQPAIHGQKPPVSSIQRSAHHGPTAAARPSPGAPDVPKAVHHGIQPAPAHLAQPKTTPTPPIRQSQPSPSVTDQNGRSGVRPVFKPIDNQPLQQGKPVKSTWTDPSSHAAQNLPSAHPPSVQTVAAPREAPSIAQNGAFSEKPQNAQTYSQDGRHLKREAPAVLGTPPAVEKSKLALNVGPLQDPRSMDTLSSPGSTAQTATTPAVADTSTNTSPDHEGMQGIEKIEAESTKSNGLVTPTAEKHERLVIAETPGSVIATSREVEAQLLRDSAEAAEARSNQPEETKATTSPQAPVNIAAARGPESGRPVQTTSAAAMNRTHPKPDGDVVMADVPVLKQNVNDQPAKDTRPSELPRFDQTVAEPPKPQDPPESASFTPQPEKAVTHIASGATKQRSVLDILAGDPPKSATTSRPTSSGAQSQVPITPTSQSPRPRGRSLVDRFRAKEKSKLSTVVFGKQSRKASDSSRSMVHTRSKSVGHIPSDDYFTPLFVHGFSNGSKWMKPLEQILHHAHKTIATPDSYTQILDNQACKVLRRVYQLQQQDKWSLRQPKRCPEPTRPTSHWDVMLKEMKWMRTDFREERKWKHAVARNLANACAEWVSLKGDPREQRALQINAAIPTEPAKGQWSDAGELVLSREDVKMADGLDAQGSDHHPTPELVASGDADSPSDHVDDPSEMFLDTVAPSAIFALDDNDVVFGLSHSPNTNRLLDELPMYGSPLKVPEPDLVALKTDPDAQWKREALPLSKYVEGRMELEASEPPRKRSRYQYVQEDEDDDEVVFSHQGNDSSPLSPENPHVALFQPANKPIRDRLHAGHQFRPPNEHTMPFQSFYESRSCSQWTINEDDELRALVREYSYNWSLISNMLSTKSVFASGAERRTPWECFERWVMLEGLPHDMQKTQYFKLWQGRIDSAQQTIRQQNQNALAQQAQQQQQPPPQQSQTPNGGSGPVTPIVRRRLSLPVKVERRRNQKHLTMIDAMRKLAKKRETTVQKQQHAAGIAAMRKAQEQPQARVGPIKTPREYSIMRWERDQAMAERLAERMAQHQQQRAAEAQRRARNAVAGNASNSNANRQTQAQQLQARAQQGQAAQLAAAQQNAQMSPNPTAQLGATHPHAAVARPNSANHMAVNGQARPRMPMQGTPNGNGAQSHVGSGNLVAPMQMNGNGQMQVPVVNGQARMSIPATPDLATVMQAQRISEQQRQAVQLRQAQQQQQPHQMQQTNNMPQTSPPANRATIANGVNQKSYLNNNAQAMLFNASNSPGISTPPASGLTLPAGHSGSPRPQMPPQIHQTYLTQLQHIENQIRQSHPNTPQEMVREMARQLLQNRHNNLAQSAREAMNAAAGGSGQTPVANGPHQYAQLLRAQQQAQAAAAAQAQQQHSQHPQHNSPQSQQSQHSPQLQQQQSQQQTAQHTQHPHNAQQQQQQQHQQHAGQNGQKSQLIPQLQQQQQQQQQQRNGSAGSPTPPVPAVAKS